MQGMMNPAMVQQMQQMQQIQQMQQMQNQGQGVPSFGMGGQMGSAVGGGMGGNMGAGMGGGMGGAGLGAPLPEDLCGGRARGDLPSGLGGLDACDEDADELLGLLDQRIKRRRVLDHRDTLDQKKPPLALAQFL